MRGCKALVCDSRRLRLISCALFCVAILFFDRVAPIALAQKRVAVKGTNKPMHGEEIRGGHNGSVAAARDAAASTTVIAEGVGESADEALKDAFRNAVRQVVGAVVDAETLIKNEDVVDDKVLTYSDGFIKHYDEISKKASKSLHRVKIKAQVERRSVVAKLKAAKVTVKELDGAGLFAEAVTQLEAEENAASLLRKAFAGFPGSVVALTEEGKPEITEKSADKATIRVNVLVQPDMAAYMAFVGRLQPILEKIAKEKGEFGAVFKPTQAAPGRRDSPFELPQQQVPKVFFSKQALEPDAMMVALAIKRSARADRLECRYYFLDKVLQPTLAEVAFRSQSAKVSLQDGDDEAIAVERFALSDGTWFSAGSLMAAWQIGTILPVGLRFPDQQKSSAFWIAPVFLSPGITTLVEQPYSRYSVAISLSLEELKEVKKVRIETVPVD